MGVHPDDPQGPGVAAEPESASSAEAEAAAAPPPPAAGAPATPAPGTLELAVSVLLRSGVAVATTLIVVGTTLSFLRHPDYRTSRKALAVLLDPSTPRAPGALLAALPELRGQPFVLLGLVLLVATPVARVAVTSALLARSGERRLAAFGLAVLLLLMVSYLFGGSSG